KYGRDRGHIGVESGRDAPLDAAQERLGCGKVVLPRKQKCDIDRYAREDSLLDCRQAFSRSWNLDQQVRTGSPRKQILRGRNGAGRVVSQEGRHFQRYPSIHTIRLFINGPKQVGRPRKVLERELEEKRLTRFAPAGFFSDRRVISRTVFDGMVKDSWI